MTQTTKLTHRQTCNKSRWKMMFSPTRLKDLLKEKNDKKDQCETLN